MSRTLYEKLKRNYDTQVEKGITPYAANAYVRSDYGYLFDKNGRPRSFRDYNTVVKIKGGIPVSREFYESLIEDYMNLTDRQSYADEIRFQTQHLKEIFYGNPEITKWLDKQTLKRQNEFYNSVFFSDDIDFEYDDLKKIEDTLTERFRIGKVGRPGKDVDLDKYDEDIKRANNNKRGHDFTKHIE